MPQQEELSEAQVLELMHKAQAAVDSMFSPQDHLPPKVYEWLLPISTMSCQGMYSVTMMLLGAMAALTNGGSVKIWNQKPTPLVALVFQIATPQKGKSRLFQVIEEMFDTCDEKVKNMADAKWKELKEKENASPGDTPSGGVDGGQAIAEALISPLTVTSINMQSFTFTQFFYRLSTEFPQIEHPKGDKSLPTGMPNRLWDGNGLHAHSGHDNGYDYIPLALFCRPRRSSRQHDLGQKSCNFQAPFFGFGCGQMQIRVGGRIAILGSPKTNCGKHGLIFELPSSRFASHCFSICSICFKPDLPYSARAAEACPLQHNCSRVNEHSVTRRVVGP